MSMRKKFSECRCHKPRNSCVYSSVPKVLGQPGNGTQAAVVDTSNFGGGVPGQIESPYRPPTFKRKPEI